MAERLIFDTTFLIDLERELSKRTDGRAQRFFTSREAFLPCVSAITAGEFAVGFKATQRRLREEALSPYEVLDIDGEATWHYAMIYRHLRRQSGVVFR